MPSCSLGAPPPPTKSSPLRSRQPEPVPLTASIPGRSPRRAPSCRGLSVVRPPVRPRAAHPARRPLPQAGWPRSLAAQMCEAGAGPACAGLLHRRPPRGPGWPGVQGPSLRPSCEQPEGWEQAAGEVEGGDQEFQTLWGGRGGAAGRRQFLQPSCAGAPTRAHLPPPTAHLVGEPKPLRREDPAPTARLLTQTPTLVGPRPGLPQSDDQATATPRPLPPASATGRTQALSRGDSVSPLVAPRPSWGC